MSTTTANPELRAALQAALAAVHLEGSLEAACTWCGENGAWGLEELAADDVFPDFANDVGLKRLEARRLLKVFEGASGSTKTREAATEAHASPVFAPQPRGFFPGRSGYQPAVVVKNTFLDFNSPELLAGNRANTLPVKFPDDDSEEEEEEDEDDAAEEGSGGEAQAALLASPTGSIKMPAVSSNPLTCKLTTFDNFESSTYWDWQEARGGGNSSLPDNTSACPADHPAASATSASDMANMMYMPSPMWPGMAPMMYPMVPMPMDATVTAQQMQTQAQMQMAMAGMMIPSMGTGTVMTTLGSETKPRDKVMERVFSMATQRERIRWTVDARKLKSSDREAVSPNFEVSCGELLSFKMVLKPKAMDSAKGGACFKKSRNKGSVELRCVTELDSPILKPFLTFRMQITSDRRSEPFRGPVYHNFAERSMCGLPDGQDEWDFGKVVDRTTNTFAIVLEVLRDES